MKFALVNGIKTEPKPGLHGTCANCQSETVAKCGNLKVWHWAHKSKRTCDQWWENETEWHRKWKNHFPTEWQEVIHTDSNTGEKHIADVKTDKELVIEFQHSAIKPEEIQSREAFYKNMVWVVDGTRLKNDYPRFRKKSNEFRGIEKLRGFFLFDYPEECFPARWLTSSTPVYFDFQANDPTNQSEEMRNVLWCLFPKRVGRYVVIAAVLRKQFLELASTNPELLFAEKILKELSELFQLQQEIIAAQTRRANSKLYNRRRRHRRL